jgi:T4 RnlA family RNA ligase
MCQKNDSPFYEAKVIVDDYPISLFNYRLASSSDFKTYKSREMRGICFVFNKDGSLFERFILLEKFFNLNQVPESMYSIVKNYKIKAISNKEDGSIASFIKLPSGKIFGKSKMGFDNEQADGINRIYKNRQDVKEFVDWCIKEDIVPVFEYVSPANRIVLRYLEEDLILLRMRDNKTGKHLDIKNYLDKIGTIRIAPFEDDYKDLDQLIEVIATQVDKEGVIVQAEDESGKDFFFKLKTPWYIERHGLLTNDLYREHIIVGYILDDKIDDILGQVPEDEKEARERINKIIRIIKSETENKKIEILKSYQKFLELDSNRKEYALNFRQDPNFHWVMKLAGGADPYDLAKDYIREKNNRLLISRDWLKSKDPSLFFQEPDPDKQD